MDLSEDILDEHDYLYVGFDRLRFISCDSCTGFSAFLFHLPQTVEDIQLVSETVKSCVECLPLEQLRKCYPFVKNRVYCNVDLLELFKGFKYSNPFYRKFARLDRLLITMETTVDTVTVANLLRSQMLVDVETLQNLFPIVHRLTNRRYWGQQEIAETIKAKVAEIRLYYELALVDEDMQTDSNVSEGNEIDCDAHLDAQANMSTYEPNDNLCIAADPRFKLKLLSADSDFPCDICLLTAKHHLKFGDFIEKQLKGKVLRCHYFCLLSGTYIYQGGQTDKAGILGFLVNDIYASFPKYRDKICNYCNCSSAPIKCNAEKCERRFHYICGYNNNCLTQFINEYSSYCHEHLPIRHEKLHGEDTLCWICWENMSPYNPVSSFCSSCPPQESSKKQSLEYTWYHRKCMQRYASESGYYFKCPNCYESKNFSEHAKLHGIFVPMRDATWELEPNAYKDIQGSRCTAEKDCMVKNGVKISAKLTNLVGCKACGGETMHMRCAGVDDPDDYVCSKCMDATFIKLF
ncbi:PHD finger protein 7-like [Topomyia yanbarensis]|uniref:PHD finger protein 7-like n=1 Tax=Topomyia yanbarensis TaxID=2498891 RepID=UPI00273CCB37|nr:PHD finger protein 7-like [Topomyia yanbarensis]